MSGAGSRSAISFHFGSKYSKPLGALVAKADGEQVPVQMGSYGIGVSRLVGAVIEASHDEAGIIWPDSVAPFHVGLVNLKNNDAATNAKCDEIYAKLTAQASRSSMTTATSGRGRNSPRWI
jgi:Prolyl-tRNA synthetase